MTMQKSKWYDYGSHVSFQSVWVSPNSEIAALHTDLWIPVLPPHFAGYGGNDSIWILVKKCNRTISGLSRTTP